MFDPLQFTDDLLTGQADIDSQHAQIFAWANDLFFGTTQGTGEHDLRNGLKFFAAYVVSHFAAEQQAMAESGYPDTEAHVTEHVALRARVADLVEQMVVEGVTPRLKTEVHFTLSYWLVHHIQERDRALAAFLREADQDVPSVDDLLEDDVVLPDWMREAASGKARGR